MYDILFDTVLGYVVREFYIYIFFSIKIHDMITSFVIKFYKFSFFSTINILSLLIGK